MENRGKGSLDSIVGVQMTLVFSGAGVWEATNDARDISRVEFVA